MLLFLLSKIYSATYAYETLQFLGTIRIATKFVFSYSSSVNILFGCKTIVIPRQNHYLGNHHTLGPKRYKHGVPIRR